jgi:hypothetical protein
VPLPSTYSTREIIDRQRWKHLIYLLSWERVCSRHIPLCIQRVGRAHLQNCWVETRARLCGWSGFYGVFSRLLTEDLNLSGRSSDGAMNIYLVHDFKQHTMLTYVNGVTSSLSIGPSVGYTMISEFVKFSLVSTIMSIALMFVFATRVSSRFTRKHIYMSSHICYRIFVYVQICTILKLPKFLTIQK